MLYKNLHFIWISRAGAEMPAACAKNLGAWKSLYPDFKLKLWTELDLSILDDEILFKMWRDDKFDEAMVSVRMRFLILYQFGGIYADIDTIPLKRMDNLLLDGSEFIIGKKYAFDTVDSNLCYSPAGHCMVGELLRQFDICTSNKTNDYIHSHPTSVLYPAEYFQAQKLTYKSYSSHWPNRLGSWINNKNIVNRELISL
jgi:mannosyltransferase OCH1-like enzyme